MSRLTELIEYYSWKVNELAEGYEIATIYMETGEIKEYNKGCQRIDDTLEALKELQHYKDLEEQGRLIELPIPLWKPYYEITESFNISMYILKPASAGRIIQSGLFGKYVFATKEEAEEKLKRLQENEQAL